MKKVKETRKGSSQVKKTKLDPHWLIFFIVAVPLLCSGVTCQPSGMPVMDRFTLLYDIVAIADNYQAVEWKVSNVSSVKLSLQDESGKVVHSQSISSGTSNGFHNVPISGLASGKYKVILEASNTKGSISDSREFLAVGHEGLWYRFTKYVKRPQEGPWYGFTNEIIQVTSSQGLDHKTKISVSEHVKFRHIRWKPDPLRWADREGCTVAGLNIMTIRQLTYSHTYDKGTDYPFPIGEWSVLGTYYCTVNWSPCNFGWKGGTKTYQQVVFFLELEAIGI